MNPLRELPHLQAITIRRPQSEAVMDRVKRFELWQHIDAGELALLGTHVGIHAGQHYYDRMSFPGRWIAPPMPPTGIIGVARFAGVMDLRGKRTVHLPRIGPPLTKAERAAFETIDTDPWWDSDKKLIALFFTEPVRIACSVPCRGNVGIWPVPHTAAETVRRRWIEARGADA